MRLIIHDLMPEMFERIFPGQEKDGTVIIGGDAKIHHCIGCFGCWIKTPGQCLIEDACQKMGELISKSEEVMIISECCYGSFSPFIKNVLERSISYIHPNFRIVDGQMHHQMRYDHIFRLKVQFYGDSITAREKQTAKSLVEANAVNLGCKVESVWFIGGIKGWERSVK